MQIGFRLGRVLAAHPDLRRMEEIADLVAEEGGEAFPEVRNLPRLAWEDIQRLVQQPSTGEPVLFDVKTIC